MGWFVDLLTYFPVVLLGTMVIVQIAFWLFGNRP